MRRGSALACAIVLLSSCASAPEPPQPVLRPVCPPFRAWSETDLKALGRALESIPADSAVMRMALDWRRYYGDAKACDGAKKQ
jgi:hypothetical protein